MLLRPTPFLPAGLLLLGLVTNTAFAQNNTLADSIRQQYHLPELAYAVVSSDSVLVLSVTGLQRAHTSQPAHTTDRFRIGSNTKAITGFLAAQLVQSGKISWDTRFFDLFPEMKASSRRAYHQLTLLDLLSFRTRLFPYTYTYPAPTQDQFTGTDAEQRYQFTQWFFRQKPVKGKKGIHFSNLGYTAAGLMLEKTSGQSYPELVHNLGRQLDINFGFGPPNLADTLQPWGHDAHGNPEFPADNFKLNWLLAAGNVNVSLPDYIKFIQLQLAGLNGRSPLLPRETFEFLHFGRPGFAVGWFWAGDTPEERYAYNIGNPGTFLTKVYVFPEKNRAYILFANIQSPEADAGLSALLEVLKQAYGE